jgi:hypothetical protein
MWKTGPMSGIRPLFPRMEPAQSMCSLITQPWKQGSCRMSLRNTCYLTITSVIFFNGIMPDIILLGPRQTFWESTMWRFGTGLLSHPIWVRLRISGKRSTLPLTSVCPAFTHIRDWRRWSARSGIKSTRKSYLNVSGVCQKDVRKLSGTTEAA